MLEVKLSAEEAKSGADPAELAGADRGGPRLPESAPARADDHAAMADDPEASRPYFRRLRELAEAARLDATLDGHVARSGDRDRGGLHLRARGHGAIRQADESLTSK